jgi:hypothetical protein
MMVREPGPAGLLICLQCCSILSHRSQLPSLQNNGLVFIILDGGTIVLKREPARSEIRTNQNNPHLLADWRERQLSALNSG